MSDFGAWLHAALEESGMKQKDLAKMIGTTETTISLYISGGRYPTMGKLQKIMDLFGVHMVFVHNNQDYQTKKPGGRSINLRQLLHYMTEGDYIQICEDGWDTFIEVPATSMLLKPLMDRRIICMGAEEGKDGTAIRCQLEDWE